MNRKTLTGGIVLEGMKGGRLGGGGRGGQDAKWRVSLFESQQICNKGRRLTNIQAVENRSITN